ncbi:MAG: hypothetical protein GY943_20770 [Chloroflexi bacterium]|nr:hypothetical protein [Chloroflexota bacterium]
MYWSPNSNEFVIYCPITSSESFASDNSIALFSAPAFESVDITPQSLHCPLHKGAAPLIWGLDGQQIVLNIDSGSVDYSFIGLLSKDGIKIQNTGIPGRIFDFDGWIDNQTIVYNNYLGSGVWNINVYNIELDKILASSRVHANRLLKFNEKYVVTSSGIDNSVNHSAAVIKITPAGVDTIPPTEHIHYLSFEQENDQLEPKFNSMPVDWLSDSNELLVLTWKSSIPLWDIDMLHDTSVTDLQLWNVETDMLTMLVPGAVTGRFSPDGQFLTFLTPGNPAPFLQLLNRIDGSVIFAVETLAVDINYAPRSINASFSSDSRYLTFFTPGNLEIDENNLPVTVNFDPDNPQLHLLDLETLQVIYSMPALNEALSWSPNGQKLIYRMMDDNLAILDVNNGRFTPITLNGGARLSNPQWSFDGSYLSVQVVGEGVAVLQVP